MDAATSTDGTPDPEWVAALIYSDRYVVTASGRVKSVDRTAEVNGRVRHYKERELNPWIDRAGYPTVTLYDGRGGRRTISVHQLVKEAFHGRTPAGMEVLHVDGNPAHCHLDNLVFGTSAQNKADIARHGRNYWSNREKCDLGHRLEGDNVAVVPSDPNRRRCVACTRARNERNSKRRRGIEIGVSLRELANRKYAEIFAGTDGRRLAVAAKVACPRDHLLVAPNLVESNPGRLCKACNGAHAKAAYERKCGRAFDFQTDADARYAAIMAGVDVDVLRAELLAAAEVPAVTVEPYERQPSQRLAPKPPQVSEPIPDLSGEEWRNIPGWEGTHQVSNLGRAKSLPRWVSYEGKADRWHVGKLFTPTPGRKGYLMIGLPDHTVDRKSRTFGLHILVARAFIGPVPDGLEVLHIDGDPSNARLDNLRYGTHRENGADMVRHGRTPRDRQGDTCVWGHLLEAPNLVERLLPARKCLACTRAHGAEGTARKRRGYRSSEASRRSHREMADLRYREIMGTETVEDIAARTRTQCALGHDLIPSNLVPSRLPSLYCLACSRAKGAVRFAASKGLALDMQTVSDEKFAEIIRAAAA